MTLREGEFDLDGYRFGTADNDAIILSGGLDTGAPGLRTQDFASPVDDGGFFGRDYLDGPLWSFTLGVLDDEDVYTRLAEIASAWRAEAIRKTPGAVSTLRLKRNGKTYRVYGRARRFGVSPAEIADEQWQIVEADFQVADPFMYADEEESLNLSLLNTSEPGEGIVLPATLPAELGRSSTADHGVISVESVDPTPFRVKVIGPNTGTLSDITLSGPGFEFRIDTTVAYDEQVIIDTRAQTITKNSTPIPGSLKRPSRLNARLTPGTSAVSFRASDPSRTGSAVITWRPTYPIL